MNGRPATCRRRPLLALGWWLLAVVAAWGGTITDDQKKLYIDEQLRFADGLLDRGHHALAIDEYQRLIKQFPDDPLVADAWMQLAEAYAAQGRADFARRIYEQFLQKFTELPTRTAAEVNYARLLLGSADAAEAARGRRLLEELKVRATAAEVVREAAAYHLARHLAANSPADQAAAGRELRVLATLPVTDADRHRFRACAAIEVADALLREDKPDAALPLLAPLAAGAAVPPEIQNTALQMVAAIHWNGGQFAQAAEAYGRLAVLFPDSEAGREAPVRRLESLYRAKAGRILIREVDLLLAKAAAAPHRERLLFLKAAALQDEGFFAAAAAAYAELAVSGADNETAQKAAFQQVVCLRQDGKIEAAVTAARSWLRHSRLSPATVADIAVFAASAPTPVAAGVALLREAAAAVAEPHALNRVKLQLAGLLLTDAQPAAALPLYQAIAADPAATDLREPAGLGAAACLEELGRGPEAAVAYREIISGQPSPETLDQATLRLAMLLLRDPERWPDAASELTALRQRRPGTAAALSAAFYLGHLEFARGDHAAAERQLAELLKQPGLPADLRLDATVYWLWALLEQQRDEEVQRSLKALFGDEAFLARAPSEFLLSVGEHFADRAPDLAMAGFLHATTEEARMRQRALLGRGQIHAARGETEKGLAALREAAALAADPAVTCRVQSRLGELLTAAGKPDEALIHFEQALASPAAPAAAARARLGLARILAQQEDRLATANRHAMAVFILSADPALCAEAMLLSVRISLRLGRQEEAAGTWRELRHRFPAAATGAEGKQTAALLRAAGAAIGD